MPPTTNGGLIHWVLLVPFFFVLRFVRMFAVLIKSSAQKAAKIIDWMTA